MPKSYNLEYKECCKLRLRVDIHGTSIDVDATIDTGFTAEKGYGLKLPLEYSELATAHGLQPVTLADGKRVFAPSIPNALVLGIEGEPAPQVITMSTIFMGETSCVGVLFLKRCVALFDGPREQTTLTLVNANSKF